MERTSEPARRKVAVIALLSLALSVPALPASSSPLPGPAPVPLASADLAAALVAAAADDGAPATERALRAAEVAFASRQALLGSALDAAFAPLLAQEARNVATARALLPLLGAEASDPLERALAVQAVATSWQRGALGLPALGDAPAPPLATHGTLAEAARALAARHGVSLEEQGALARLDALPEPVQAPLLRTLDAFLAFHEAVAAGFAAAGMAPLDLAALADARWTTEGALDLGDPALPEADAARADLAVALGPALAARERFLATLPALRDALEHGGADLDCDPILLPPALALELTGCDTLYRENALLLIDAGGNDVYENNAGGFPGARFVYPPSSAGAAALVDFGGNDVYTDPPGTGVGLQAPVGTNGGAYAGAALLLDLAGDDRYARGGTATNGGGTRGLGLLIDAAGSNIYQGGDTAANGGSIMGAGALLDLGTGDTTFATGTGPGLPIIGGNGGGCFGGVGFLVDGDGHDRYQALPGCGTNGGGGGVAPAVGFLLDAGHGADAYQGINGSGTVLSTGFLFDEGGNDVYRSLPVGAGQGSGRLGVGALIDAGGDDQYLGGHITANGGGAQRGAGHLLDLGGDDRYVAGHLGTNGGGATQGVGLLFDAAGDDAYEAGSLATNGGSFFAGTGFLLDAAGDDAYRAGGGGVNGGGNLHFPGTGFLLDLGGRDAYTDDDGGSGADLTLAPKGTFGFQLDFGGI